MSRFKGSTESGTASLGIIYGNEGNVDVDSLDPSAGGKSALEILEEKKNKKMIRVDHSSMDYISFRKNLYIIPKSLNALTDEEIADRRSTLEIKVRGRGCPPPLERWTQCGLDDIVLDTLESNKITDPFPIQKQAIPAIMAGRDVIGVAKTGSGKTLTFLLPMLRHILDQPPLQRGEGPVGLIMAPARELAYQIRDEAVKIVRGLDLGVVCAVGGANISDQIAELKRRPAHIIVCTPGRMIDLLSMHHGKICNLTRVTMIVMDEADRMFDMGFEPQIKMILDAVRPDRQTILFSATFPRSIEKLARTVLKFPIEVCVGERTTVNSDIQQLIEVHEEGEKYLRLLQLIGIWSEKGHVLVFVDKQEKCDELYQDLVTTGYACVSLHGGKEQEERDFVLNEFKTGVKNIMIATSVAGRGLDVPNIIAVINYNCPNHLEDYVHRVGRTGRAGRKGVAYTFVSRPEAQYAGMMIQILKKVNVEPAPELIALRDAYQAKGQAKREENEEKGEKDGSGEGNSSGKGDNEDDSGGGGNSKKKKKVTGFSGKGFTFDNDEMTKAQKLQAQQKKAYAVREGIDDGNDGKDENGEEGDGDKDALGAEGEAEDAHPKSSKYNQVLNTVNSLVEKLKLQVMPATPQDTIASIGPIPAPYLLPSGSIDRDNALKMATTIAKTILKVKYGDSIGTQYASNASIVKHGGKDHYQEIININEYSAPARKKVTAKGTIDDIVESFNVAIIQKGNYNPNKDPDDKDLESGLHMIIESAALNQVQGAVAEIRRLADEELLRTSGVGLNGRAGGGRYSVIS